MKARILAGVAAMTVGLLLGCSNGTDPTPTPTVSSSTVVSPSVSPTVVASTPFVSASPTPTPSATPSESPKQVLDKDQEAARDVVLEYYRLRNLYAMDPSLMDLTPLTDITTGDAQLFAVESIDYYRSNNLVQTAPALVSIQSVGEARQDASKVPVIQVSGCVDASGVDVVDAQTGESLVTTEERRPVNLIEADVVKSGKSWLVNDIATSAVEACS